MVNISYDEEKSQIKVHRNRIPALAFNDEPNESLRGKKGLQLDRPNAHQLGLIESIQNQNVLWLTRTDGLGDVVIDTTAALSACLSRGVQTPVTLYTRYAFLFEHPQLTVKPVEKPKSKEKPFSIYFSEEKNGWKYECPDLNQPFDLIVDAPGLVKRTEGLQSKNRLTRILREDGLRIIPGIHPRNCGVNRIKWWGIQRPGYEYADGWGGKMYEYKRALLTYAAAFTDSPQVADPSLYVNPHSANYSRAITFLKDYRISHDPKKRVKPLFYVSGLGGETEKKGFTDLETLMRIPFELIQEFKADVIVGINHRTSIADQTKIKDYVLKVNPKFSNHLIIPPSTKEDPYLQKHLAYFSDQGITVEGGMDHLLTALGIPNLILYSGGSGNKERWHPQWNLSIPLNIGGPSPMYAGSFDYITQDEVHEVIHNVKLLLNNKRERLPLRK